MAGELRHPATLRSYPLFSVFLLAGATVPDDFCSRNVRDLIATPIRV